MGNKAVENVSRFLTPQAQEGVPLILYSKSKNYIWNTKEVNSVSCSVRLRYTQEIPGPGVDPQNLSLL